MPCSDSTTEFQTLLIKFSNNLLQSLSATPDPPQEEFNTLRSLLTTSSTPNPNVSQSLQHLTLAISTLSSSSSHPSLSWIPLSLSSAANSVFSLLSAAYSHDNTLVVDLIPEVLPFLKERIKESCIDKSDDVSAASAGVPVGNAVVAAAQLSWFVTKVHKPCLGKLSSLVIPCALTALDHWSPHVKEHGMIAFIHVAKNVDENEICWFEDVILDACCQNIASADELWRLVVEMSVLFVTLIHRSNPRSPWFERILNETLSHLERQPRNKERSITWLTFIEPLFQSVGLVLLSHFRRIFPLFFKWMHTDDDETVLLVLKRLQTIIRLTWIRNSPYFERLVDELVALQKEAAIKKAREEIRRNIVDTMVLLRQSKGMQFESAWNKHKDDPNVKPLCISLSEESLDGVAQA